MRVYKVVLSQTHDNPHARWRYIVVAANCIEAIKKAVKRATRDDGRKSGWVVEMLKHGGVAVR